MVTTVPDADLPTAVKHELEYIDENGQLQTNYTFEVVTRATTEFADGGWYAVTEDVEITGANITVAGAAHLILCDGATLTVTNVQNFLAAIDVSVVSRVINALSIYGQTAGTGGLAVFGGFEGAGIGGGDNGAGGTVMITGGTVTATGGDHDTGVGGAGIGGGNKGAGGTVTITGGKIVAYGADGGEDIGHGYEPELEDGGTVTVSGGLFWKKPEDWWTIVVGHKVVENPETETKVQYPWAVVSDVEPTPVTPGEPVGSFETAEEASNVLKRAVFTPRADVVDKLGKGSDALKGYCDMFTLEVVPFGETQWAVKAFLNPPDWTNVVESAQSATRQIPIADIAALPLGMPTNVTATGCGVLGFYYSFYSGSTATDLKAIVAEKGRNVLVARTGTWSSRGWQSRPMRRASSSLASSRPRRSMSAESTIRRRALRRDSLIGRIRDNPSAGCRDGIDGRKTDAARSDGVMAGMVGRPR